MRQHQHLPAMMRFVRDHVAQHLRPNRPGPRQAVSQKHLHAALAAERFGKHLRAQSGAVRQCRAGLLRRAVRAVELCRNLQVRSCKPDPLGADIVHVREDGHNGADVACRFRIPDSRVKVFDDHLVHALVGGKNLHRGLAELRSDFFLTRGHRFLLLAP